MGGLDTASTSTVWSAERPTASAMSSKSSNIATSNSSDPMMAAPNPVDTSNKPGKFSEHCIMASMTASL